MKKKVQTKKKKKTVVEDDFSELSDKHKLFCWFYVTDKDCFGNATKAYQKVYKVKSKVAGASGPRLLANVRLQEYKNKLLSDFFTDEVIDNELSYLILQNKDLKSKVAAIKEANNLKGRIVEKKDITSGGKPIPLLYALRDNQSDNKDIETEEED